MPTVNKKWWLSKVLWVNLIALVALVLQTIFGWQVSPETQAYIIVGINALLRLLTKEGLVT